MLTIVLCWVVLFFIISLIGKLFIRDAIWYEYFWVGLVVAFGILQIWSIFLPVNIYAFIFILLISLITFRVPKLSLIFKFVKNNYAFVFVSFFVIIFISYFASLPVGWGDTYLYHLNAVKWSNLYSVVPGLVNMHSRLAFNSSFFLFASMIDNWFLTDRSSHVALSLLSIVLSLQIFWIITKSNSRLAKIFGLFALPLLICSIAVRTMVASLSPDFAVIMLVFAIALSLLQQKSQSWYVGGLLSILLLTIKFNGLAFSGVILLSLLFRLEKQKIYKLIYFGLFLVIPFLIRNVILSGWLLYPLPYFGFNLPWAARIEDVRGMYNVIHAWAITPGEGWTRSLGLSFWQWFPDWYTRNSWHIGLKIFSWGILMTIIYPFIGEIGKNRFKENINLFIIGLATFVAAFYTLFTAPDFRFGEIYLWTFFAFAVTLVSKFLLDQSRIFKIPLLFVAVYFIFVVGWPPRVDSKPILRSVRWETSFDKGMKEITPNDGSPSFKIYTPDDDSLCGNSKLPCTPDSAVYKGRTKEIVPGDISKGYAPVN